MKIFSSTNLIEFEGNLIHHHLMRTSRLTDPEDSGNAVSYLRRGVEFGAPIVADVASETNKHPLVTSERSVQLQHYIMYPARLQHVCRGELA